MGWAAGSDIMSQLIRAVELADCTKKQRVIIYIGAIDALKSEDCDTLDECRGEDPVYDEVLETM